MRGAGSTIDVSVVIPAYNAAATIGDQLAALGRQDFAGTWEVVVAVQRSTDATAEVVGAWDDPRVRLVEAYEQLGAGYARNVGVRAAQADVIAFCDADDIVADDWLSELVRHRPAPVVAGGIVDIKDSSELETARGADARMPTVECAFLPTAYSCSMLVDKQAYTEVGGFDLYFHRNHDVELSWRLQLAGYAITLAPSARVYKRERATSSGLWMQNFRWARYEPAFYRRFSAAGMPRSSSREAARDWVWLVVRLPRLRNPWVRADWSRRSATRLGRIVGSLVERRMYL